eukprot:291414-Prorocentrum_minimum.AAC.1
MSANDEGIVTLVGNSYAAVGITVSTVCLSEEALTAFYGLGVSFEVSDTDAVYANQAADTFQFKLGNAAGAQFDPVAVGESLPVPVVFNVGTDPLSSFDLVISYTATDLQATSCTVGTDWATYEAFFTCTINDPPGEVKITGVQISTSLTGTLSLADLTLTSLRDFGTTPISGTSLAWRSSTSSSSSSTSLPSGSV